MSVNAVVVRPGDTVPIRASVPRDHHPGYELVPAACLSDWRVSPAGSASVADDGTSLTIAPDLPAGTNVIVEARTPGDPARATVVIVGRDEARLVGRYYQVEVACDGPEPRQPIRELTFSRDGGFAVTWTPFETYQDYWGDYVHDLESGRMTLTVTGGNHPPDGDTRLSGTARLQPEAQRLIMEGFYLGDGLSPGIGQACRYVFAGPMVQ